MHHLGIIPAQWSAKTSAARDLVQAQKYVSTAFSLAMRNSHRFHVLNDELTKSLWDSQAGRSELASDYELDIFANLVGTPLADSVVLMARILDKNLKGLIQESATISRDWLGNASYDEIEDAVTDLVFKVTNRLPTDVSVTSIQGKYVTISGGLAKGIHIGDSITLVRPYVASIHPANQYWLNFETAILGKAEIIESKESTAVAKLVALNKEGAVEIGDGAKIKSIAGRTRFVAQAAPENTAHATDAIIVPPLYTPEGKKSLPVAKPAPTSAENPPPLETSPAPVHAPNRPADNVKTVPQPASPPVEAEGAKPAEKSPAEAAKESDASESDYLSQFYSPFAFDRMTDVVAKVADRITFQVGQTKWWYVGPGDTGSKLVWYLPVNTVGARITREIMPQIKYGIGGGIGFGKTENKGDYFSYDSHIRIFWETNLIIAGGLIQKAQAGAQGNFSGLSATNERYGGGDWVQGGIFGGLLGQFMIPQVVDWYGEFAIIPLTVGRLGYDGTRKTVRASFGWKLGLGGYLVTAPQSIEWGGGLDYSGMNLHDSTGKETGLSTISGMALARYRF